MKNCSTPIKEKIHKDTVLAVPSTDYPFHIHVDAGLELSFSRFSQQKHHNRRISKAPAATHMHSARY